MYEVFQYRDLRMLSCTVVLGGFALPEEVDGRGGEEGGVEDVREVFGDGHPLRDLSVVVVVVDVAFRMIGSGGKYGFLSN